MTSTRLRPTRARRLLAAVVLGGTLTVAALPAAALDTAAASPTARVAPVGWGDGSGGAPGGYSAGAGSPATVDSDPATTAESKGVVLIDTTLTGGSGAGTGIVLTGDGEVLTNYHVVEGATAISVTLASTGKTYQAEVVGHSESSDIALLQLDDASGLPVAAIDDDTLRRGDDVTAVGNAGGTGTLTAADGTVTSLTASVTTAAEGAIASQTLTKMIETDADVVSGDSGGPLLDDEHEVVGIDTAASTGAEINGYAIPIDRALAVVAQITSGKETSTVQIGASGFLGVQVDSSAASGYAGGYWGNAGYDRWSAGAPLSGVVDGGPAAAAGLETGDTITAIGSTAVGSASDLTEAIAEHDAGDRVTVTWLDSAGGEHNATVTLAASPMA